MLDPRDLQHVRISDVAAAMRPSAASSTTGAESGTPAPPPRSRPRGQDRARDCRPVSRVHRLPPSGDNSHPQLPRRLQPHADHARPGTGVAVGRRAMSALASDTVTIARCTAGHRATKLIRGTPDGGFTIEGYDAGKYLAAETQAVSRPRRPSRGSEQGRGRPQELRPPRRAAAGRRPTPLPPAPLHPRGRHAADLPRGAAALGRDRLRRRARPLPLRSARRRAGGDLLPHAAAGAVAALLLLVGPVVLGRLQARRADQAGVLARSASAGQGTRAAPQGLPDRREHAAGRAADLCRPADPGRRGRPDPAAHRRRARHPRRRWRCPSCLQRQPARRRPRTRPRAGATSAAPARTWPSGAWRPCAAPWSVPASVAATAA